MLGTPALFATAYGNVGSSIYYALGVVAVYALGLTPLVVAAELPLDAQFAAETAELRAGMGEAATIADSYGVGTRRRLVRTRSRALGLKLAEVAHDHRAELIVVGAPVESRRGFRRAFPPEVMSVLREAPCRVMVATGPAAAGGV